MPAMLASMLGLEPAGFEGRLTVRRPRLPSWLPSVELRSLRVGAGRADLRFERDGRGATRMEVVRADGLDVRVAR